MFRSPTLSAPACRPLQSCGRLRSPASSRREFCAAPASSIARRQGRWREGSAPFWQGSAKPVGLAVPYSHDNWFFGSRRLGSNTITRRGSRSLHVHKTRLWSASVAPGAKLGARMPAWPAAMRRRAMPQDRGSLPSAIADLVGAQHARVDLEGEALVRFLDRASDGEAKIKRGNALWIEAAAVDGGAIAGKRLERPPGIMRPVAGSAKSQAKPPMAMWSR